MHNILSRINKGNDYIQTRMSNTDENSSKPYPAPSLQHYQQCTVDKTCQLTLHLKSDYSSTWMKIHFCNSDAD